jgi:hypothetical protein
MEEQYNLHVDNGYKYPHVKYPSGNGIHTHEFLSVDTLLYPYMYLCVGFDLEPNTRGVPPDGVLYNEQNSNEVHGHCKI